MSVIERMTAEQRIFMSEDRIIGNWIMYKKAVFRDLDVEQVSAVLFNVKFMVNP